MRGAPEPRSEPQPCLLSPTLRRKENGGPGSDEEAKERLVPGDPAPGTTYSKSVNTSLGCREHSTVGAPED